MCRSVEQVSTAGKYGTKAERLTPISTYMSLDWPGETSAIGSKFTVPIRPFPPCLSDYIDPQIDRNVDPH